MSIIIKTEFTASLNNVDTGKTNIFFDGLDQKIKYKKSDGSINLLAGASGTNSGNGVAIFSGSQDGVFIFKTLLGVSGVSVINNTAENTLIISSTLLDRLPDISASYLTVGNTSSLPNERRLQAGSGLSTNDTGANGVFQFSAPFVSSVFIILAPDSNLPNGIPGKQLFADASASYIILSATASLPNERVLTQGPGITLTDNGANNTLIISASVTSSVPVSGTNLGNGSFILSGVQGNSPQLFSFFSLSGVGGITTTNSGNFIVISSSVTTHAQYHIRSGSDEIDGDKLDIDYSASNYTPTTTGSLTTSTEELTSHLHGINNRLGDLMALNISSSATGAFTVSSNDIRKYIRFTAAVAITCSVSTSHGYSTGHTTIFVAAGTGQIMFGSGSGVTVNHPGSGSNPRTRTRFSSMMLTCISGNTFDLTGDVVT